VLKLTFGAMMRAAEPWRAIEISTFERRQLDALRNDLSRFIHEGNFASPDMACVRAALDARFRSSMPALVVGWVGSIAGTLPG
jgi:hypothetical protein